MNASLLTTTARSLFALALTFMILFGGVAESIHNAQVGHEICPEHGEVLHVASGHAQWDHVQSSHGHGVRVQPAEQAAEHDHCLFATLLGSSNSPWTGGPTRIVVPHTASVRPLRATVARPDAIPPLSFAPKHSPPVRAV